MQLTLINSQSPQLTNISTPRDKYLLISRAISGLMENAVLSQMASNTVIGFVSTSVSNFKMLSSLRE